MLMRGASFTFSQRVHSAEKEEVSLSLQQDRDSHFFRYFFVLFCYRKIPAEYNTWHFIGHDLSQHLGTFLYTDLFHISIFHLSDDLDTMVVKIIKKICQLQGRTVGVRLGDLYIFNIYFQVSD